MVASAVASQVNLPAKVRPVSAIRRRSCSSSTIRSSALRRVGALPGANGALDPTKVSLLTARERKECLPLSTNVDTFWFPQDFWKLRDVTVTIPVGWAIRRASSATLSITAQNYLKWINKDLRLFDPEMVGRDALDSQNRDISEHIPPPAVITFNLHATF